MSIRFPGGTTSCLASHVWRMIVHTPSSCLPTNDLEFNFMASLPEKITWGFQNMPSRFTNLYNSVHRTCLLTESAVDAFGHVNVITGCPPATVSTRLCFYGNSLDEDIVERRTVRNINRGQCHLHDYKSSLTLCVFIYQYVYNHWRLYLSRADGFTQLAGNATLLSWGVPDHAKKNTGRHILC